MVRKKINVDWIKKVKEEHKEAFVESVLINPVVERLREILKEKAKDRNTFKEVDYNNPSWGYFAADRNGYLRAIEDILKLLEINSHDRSE